MEQKACAVSHPNLNVLKQKLTKAWDDIDAEIVRATCGQVVPRLRRVVKEKRDYIL